MALLKTETMILGETTFTIGSLPATVGWDLSAKVANILSAANIFDPNFIPKPERVSGAGEETEEDEGISLDPAAIAMGVGLIKGLMGIPAADARMMRNALFEYVEFTNAQARTPQKLTGAEEMAFNAAGLSSMDIWKVYAASFRLNFSEYWEGFVFLLRGLRNSRQSTQSSSPGL